jgi:hypothetical protein
MNAAALVPDQHAAEALDDARHRRGGSLGLGLGRRGRRVNGGLSWVVPAAAISRESNYRELAGIAEYGFF